MPTIGAPEVLAVIVIVAVLELSIAAIVVFGMRRR